MNSRCRHVALMMKLEFHHSIGIFVLMLNFGNHFTCEMLRSLYSFLCDSYLQFIAMALCRQRCIMFANEWFHNKIFFNNELRWHWLKNFIAWRTHHNGLLSLHMLCCHHLFFIMFLRWNDKSSIAVMLQSFYRQHNI